MIYLKVYIHWERKPIIRMLENHNKDLRTASSKHMYTRNPSKHIYQRRRQEVLWMWIILRWKSLMSQIDPSHVNVGGKPGVAPSWVRHGFSRFSLHHVHFQPGLRSPAPWQPKGFRAEKGWSEVIDWLFKSIAIGFWTTLVFLPQFLCAWFRTFPQSPHLIFLQQPCFPSLEAWSQCHQNCVYHSMSTSESFKKNLNKTEMYLWMFF